MAVSALEAALDSAGQLLSEKKTDKALASILGVFGFAKEEGQVTSDNAPWALGQDEHGDGADASTSSRGRTRAEELACLGVECCNQLAERSLCARDWPEALRLSASAERLSSSTAWRNRWRFDLGWAIGRFQALRFAAEALRSVDGVGKNLAAARDRLLQCEKVLDAWPNHSWHPENVQVLTYLAEIQWQLRDLAAARHSCRRALSVQAARQSTAAGARARLAEVYSSLFVLWVLNCAVAADRSWSEVEASLRCAKYLVRQLEKDVPGERCASQAESMERCRRLLRKMKWNERNAGPPYEKDPTLLRFSTVERADLGWLLSSWDEHPPPGAAARERPPCGGAAAAPGPAAAGAAGAASAAARGAATLSGRPAARGVASSGSGGAAGGTDAAAGEVSGAVDGGSAGGPQSRAAIRGGAGNRGRPAGPINLPTGPSVVMLAIQASFPGKSVEVPVWKVDLDARHKATSVVRLWAREHLGVEDVPPGLQVTAGPGGAALNLQEALASLRPSLPVRDARFLMSIVWPADVRLGADGPATPLGRLPSQTPAIGKLMSLNVSCRYANVDGSVMGWHTSSTYKAKLEAGVYDESAGLYAQTAYVEAMRSPPALSPGTLAGLLVDETVGSCELVVFSDHSFIPHGAAKPGQEAFRATLKGPATLLANWEHTCKRFEESRVNDKAVVDKLMPCPTFIPTRGRAQRSNLNWEAEHVYGPLGRAGRPTGRFPVVCVAVEPAEEAEYREAWPQALMLVLPRDGGGPGFARWAIQRVCTRAFQWRERPGSEGSGKWQERRLPWIWVFDDSLSMFYRLVDLEADLVGDPHKRTGVQRIKQREAPEGMPMFREAMLEVQRHTFLPRAAVAGFLRDDGTASCKKMGWKMDEMSLWKVVFLNLPELRRLQVEYLPDLQLYEDVCLNHEVLKNGGHTLKCQSFCFRAAHARQGGCSEQVGVGRRNADGTTLQDLVPAEALARLSGQRRKTVEDLLGWVRAKEQACVEKGGRPPQEDIGAPGEALAQDQLERRTRAPPAKTGSPGAGAGASTAPACVEAGDHPQRADLNAASDARAQDQLESRTRAPAKAGALGAGASASPVSALRAPKASRAAEDSHRAEKLRTKEQKKVEAKAAKERDLAKERENRKKQYEQRKITRDHRQEYIRRMEVKAGCEADIVKRVAGVAVPAWDPQPSHYAALGVQKTADQAKVERAFTRAALKSIYYASGKTKCRLEEKLDFSPPRARRFRELAEAYHAVLKAAPENARAEEAPGPMEVAEGEDGSSESSSESSSGVSLRLSSGEGGSGAEGPEASSPPGSPAAAAGSGAAAGAAAPGGGAAPLPSRLAEPPAGAARREEPAPSKRPRLAGQQPGVAAPQPRAAGGSPAARPGTLATDDAEEDDWL